MACISDRGAAAKIGSCLWGRGRCSAACGGGRDVMGGARWGTGSGGGRVRCLLDGSDFLNSVTFRVRVSLGAGGGGGGDSTGVPVSSSSSRRNSFSGCSISGGGGDGLAGRGVDRDRDIASRLIPQRTRMISPTRFSNPSARLNDGVEPFTWDVHALSKSAFLRTGLFVSAAGDGLAHRSIGHDVL